MRVFVSGITGSLGTALARLHAARGDQVWGCGRGEARAVQWLAEHGRLATLYVCDAARLGEPYSDLGRLLPSMDRFYHCAAMKHVDVCEQNAMEAVIQNVELTDTVAVSCRNRGVPMVFVSSDKACLPEGVYGATKLIAERAAVRHGAAAVRLGNLAGSSGSVLAVWRDARAAGRPVRVTDPEMTRYFMPAGEAAAFLADHAAPGAVCVPRALRAVRMGDLAAAAAGPEGAEVLGPRPGEVRHQWLVAPGERARPDGPRLVLGEGEPVPAGMGSATAPRWDAAALLRLAGWGD